METKTLLPKLKILSLGEYESFNNDKKIETLQTKGVLVDDYIGHKISVYLYYLSGFFVEITIANRDKKVVDITSFSKNFKIDGPVKTSLSEMRHQA